MFRRGADDLLEGVVKKSDDMVPPSGGRAAKTLGDYETAISPQVKNHYWARTKKIIDEYLKKNPDSYAARLFAQAAKSGDMDRAYARALSPDDGNIFSKLPKDLQDEWALKKAFDQETGETITLAEHDTIRGTHIFNVEDDLERTMLNDAETIKNPTTPWNKDVWK